MCGRPVGSFLVAASAAVCGCAQFGPSTIQTARFNYNEAINRTTNEQMLLNLVRLKYRDTPFFLEISAVSNSYQFGASMGSKGEANTSPFFTSITPGLNYAERPNVSYTPLRGGEFVKRLLSPLSLETLILMYHSGWSVERVFDCCVQRMNGVRNAPSASGPTPDYLPQYEDFRRVVKIMRELQKTDGMDFGVQPQEGGAAVTVMRIAEGVSGSPEVREFRKILRLAEDENVYQLTTEVVGLRPDRLGVSTRSLLGVLFYLSQSVEVPAEHEVLGKVTVTEDESGVPFDWSEVTGDVMRIRWSRFHPRDAAVAVRYRDVWFYIDDSDLNSKSSFSLVSQLFMLQAGDVEMQMPLLTLPVGG